MSTRVEPTEEIEGLDVPTSEPFRDYPIDSLHIRREMRTIFEVVRRISQDLYIMDPDFQRDFVWDIQRQSRLVESVLMRIPLPVFYLAEDEEGRLIVVDGLQRLTTFKRFLDNQLTLTLANQELAHKAFDDLPSKLRNRIEDAQLILYIIDHKVPEQAKFDIFERVNSGVPLTRQQMRNCLYQGKSTRWLRQQAQSELFQQTTGHSLKSHTMRDREVINRFCSFLLLGHDSYRGNMDEFLADGLKQMNKLSDEHLNTLRDVFHRSLENNRHLFDKHAFRKYRVGQTRRKPFNVALFDVFSVLLAKRDRSEVCDHVTELQDGFFRLMDDEAFETAISNATNSSARVETRFNKVSQMISEVLDADRD